MSSNVLKFQRKAERLFACPSELLNHLMDQPIQLSPEQCVKAREMLGWSIMSLSKRSRVSEQAIAEFEYGQRFLYEVTQRAIAYTFEQQGLVFIPGLKPLWGEDARGVLEDPSTRADYHMLE